MRRGSRLAVHRDLPAQELTGVRVPKFARDARWCMAVARRVDEQSSIGEVTSAVWRSPRVARLRTIAQLEVGRDLVDSVLRCGARGGLDDVVLPGVALRLLKLANEVLVGTDLTRRAWRSVVFVPEPGCFMTLY